MCLTLLPNVQCVEASSPWVNCSKKGKNFNDWAGSLCTISSEQEASEDLKLFSMRHQKFIIQVNFEMWCVQCFGSWFICFIALQNFCICKKMYYCKLSFEYWKYEIECDCLLLQKLNPDPEFRTLKYNKKSNWNICS